MFWRRIAYPWLPSRLIALAALLVALAAGLATSSSPAQAATVTVPTGDIWFCSASFADGVCDTTITAGDTVVWDLGVANIPHTVMECGASCDDPTDSPLWDSGILDAGESFQFRFTQAGTYLYFCEVHPFAMRGRVIVQAAQVSPTSPPGQTPGADATATPRTVAPVPEGLPTNGQGPQSGAAGGWWTLAGLAATGAALLALGAAAYARAQRQ